MKTFLLKTKIVFYSFFLLTFFYSSLYAQNGLPEFFNDDWVPKNIQVSAYDTITPVSDPATVMVTVNADSVLSKVSKYVYGHNAAAWGGKIEQSAQLVTEITALAPNIIRWPGGNLSQEYFWKATSKSTCPKDLPPTFNYGDLDYGSNESSWTMSVNSFYSLLQKTHSTGMISVNYAYARYGTGEDPVLTAAKYAADWVRYDNGRTRYWEIGNENFGSWEAGYSIDQSYNKDGQPATISGELYGKHCRVFIEEMRKAAKEVGNDIKIGVVAMDQNVTYDAVEHNWNAGMMKEVGNMADYIIVHSYHTPYNQNSNISTILNSYTASADIRQYVDDGLKSAINHAPIPLALTEWNIFATGSGQAVSYINGIHAALVLGELIKEGYGQGSRWDFLNGYSDGNSHGLFADEETDVPKYSPRAPFFYMYYFQKFFGDRMVYSSVSGSSDIVSFASRFSSGQSGVVLVNKGSTAQVISVNMNNFKAGNHYYYYLLTGGTDNGDFSRKVYVNGKTTTYAGGGPSDYATLKPYGDSIQGDIKLNLPKYSTLYLLVDQDTSLLDQTIQFDPIPDKTLTDTSFVISATATSGLPVRFATMNPGVAKVYGDTVQIIGAGTCGIIAYQDGDTTYNPAVPDTNSFTVAKTDQVITMDSIDDVKYSPDPFAIVATASSGLPVQLGSTNTLVATITTNGLVKPVGIGTATIIAMQPGNVNYNAAESVSIPLTIIKGDQTISFPSITDKTAIDPDFSPGAEASSGLSCSFTSSNTAVATIINNTIHITGVGTTVITASQTGNSLYNAADTVNQTLYVVKADQTITFPALPAQTVGDPDFSPGATASSGLMCTYISSDTTVASIMDNMIHIKGDGTTTITAQQEGDTIYNPAPEVSQDLTVSTPSGIQQVQADEACTILPNPATTFVNIRLTRGSSKITIYNVLGSVVYRSPQAASDFTIPVGQIGEPGIYILRSNSIIKKFTIAR